MYRLITKLRTLAPVALLAAIAVAAPHSASAQDKPAEAPAAAEAKAPDTVIATVGDKSITEADLKLANEEIGADLTNLPEEVKRRALTEYLIDNLLFADAAVAAKLDETDEFKHYMAYLRQRALREQYFEKNLKGAVSEDEAKKIYIDRLKTLKPEEEFSARHILVDSEDKAKELRAKIEKGDDFAKLAAENSIDPVSKTDGGNLGYFGVGQMVPEFEAAVIKMKKGELSEPVKTAYGWHIIRLDDRRQKAPPPFDQVKETILNSLAVRKAQEASNDLRGKSKIEYVDADIKKMVEDQKKAQTEALEAARKAKEEADKANGAAAPAAKE
jgi:peptidyl-prolyl cis-trans isomerase C